MDVYEYTFTRHKVAEFPGTVHGPHDTHLVFERLFAGRESEALAVLCLDVKNNVIGTEVVYTGNVSATLIRVGELFRTAVRLNAASIIIGHNHPSGDPTPSPDDLHMTAEALAAGRLLDIQVLDHIITAENGSDWSPAYVSLRDRGVSFDRTGVRTGGKA